MPKFPSRPTPAKVMIEARIKEYNGRLTESTIIKEQEAKEERKRHAIYESIMKNREAQTSRYRKFTAFTEQVRDMLMENTLFTICSKALEKVDKARGTNIMENYDNVSAIHSMTYKFIHENGGGAALLGKMRMSDTYFLQNTRSIIESTFKAILENVDKDDPETFKIDPVITDRFKDEIASEDTDVMADSISERITAAIGQFIEGNTKDKDAIVAALEKTADKINSLPSDRKDLKENYAMMGKKYVTEVRNRKHGLFNEMVSKLSREVASNKDLQQVYMEGAHINVGKVVEKATIMYGFLESMSSIQLIKVTPEYIRKNMLM